MQKKNLLPFLLQELADRTAFIHKIICSNHQAQQLILEIYKYLYQKRLTALLLTNEM